MHDSYGLYKSHDSYGLYTKEQENASSVILSFQEIKTKYTVYLINSENLVFSTRNCSSDIDFGNKKITQIQ